VLCRYEGSAVNQEDDFETLRIPLLLYLAMREPPILTQTLYILDFV
jgi:hypothetical protein